MLMFHTIDPAAIFSPVLKLPAPFVRLRWVMILRFSNLPTLWALGLLFLPHCTAQNSASYSIATVAGSVFSTIPNGVFGGDGGVATSAFLNLPTSVGLDSAGNLYFCDWN